MAGRVLSLQMGRLREVRYRGKPVKTGIFKEPVAGPVRVGPLGFEGDEIADPRFHGGVDKAVYAFSHAQYATWLERRPDDTLEFGAFGENITFDDLDEKDVCIGDVFELGSTRLQASEPRFPCFKLGLKFNDQSVLKLFNRFGRPGVYFRVLEPGQIAVGDTLRRVDREAARVSVYDLFRLGLGEHPNGEDVKRKTIKVAALPEKWRERFQEPS